MTDVPDPAPRQLHRLRFPGTPESEFRRDHEAPGDDVHDIATRSIDAADEALCRTKRTGRVQLVAAEPAARRAA